MFPIKVIPARSLSLLVGTSLFAALWAWQVAAARPQEKSAPPAGLDGVTLPQGAMARLGTTHWRHVSNVTFVAFAAEGREVVSSCGDGIIHVWDANSGNELRRFGELVNLQQNAIRVMRGRFASIWGRGQAFQPTTSGDGKMLAIAMPDQNIHIWDVASGKEVRSFAHGHPQFQAALEFAPDGKSLVSRSLADTHIKVWDPATGKLSRDFDEPGNQSLSRAPVPLVISPDSRLMASVQGKYGQRGFVMSVHVWDLKEGKEVQKFVDDEAGRTAYNWLRPEFSPDGKLLARPRYDAATTIYEIATGKELCKLEEVNVEHRAMRVLFSADGKTLAALRPDQTLALFDVATGKKTKEIGEPSYDVQDKVIPRALRTRYALQMNTALAWSADGKTLAQGWGNMVRLWNVESGKGNDLGTGHRGEVINVLMGPDGKTALTAGLDHTLRRWDLRTAKETSKLDLPADSFGVTLLSPRSAVIRCTDGSAHVWDIEAGKEVLKVDGIGGAINPFGAMQGQFAVSADGSVLVTSGVDGSLRVMDLHTGKARSTTRDVPDGFIGRANNRFLQGLAVSPDGSAAVLMLMNQELVNLPGGGLQNSTKYLTRLYDTETGQLMWETESRSPQSLSPRFSPDGHSIAFFDVSKIALVVLETATGKERCQFAATTGPLAFSPDGLIIAVGTTAGGIKLLSSGKEIAQLAAKTQPRVLAFSADAATLLSGDMDGTALVWNIREAVQQARKATEADAVEVQQLWAELADPDAAKAYHAMAVLGASPKQAVALFEEHLKPTSAPNATRIDKLIAELDDDEFDVRKNAFDALVKLGPQARPALKKALDGTTSLEVRKQAEELLQRLRPGRVTLTADTLRELRSIEVLETLATPDARDILEALAKGASDCRLTTESAAAVKRIRAASVSEPGASSGR